MDKLDSLAILSTISKQNKKICSSLNTSDLFSATSFFKPNWPILTEHAKIKALMTTRQDGYSAPPYGSNYHQAQGLNLAMHVGDDPYYVEQNRQKITALITAQPYWLNQMHGNRVLVLHTKNQKEGAIGDASITQQIGSTCVVMVADCLPILLADTQGRIVAAVHAGWRSLVGDIIDKTIVMMHNELQKTASTPALLTAWLGPALCPLHFQVGENVRAAFLAAASTPQERKATESAFLLDRESGIEGEKGEDFASRIRKAKRVKYYADLYALARLRLARYQIAPYSDAYCSYGTPDYFYSYRRDGVTGRMAAFIWLDQ